MQTTPGESLDQWRQEIRVLDEEIIARTARRMELALKIGQFKADNQLPVKDFRVEKDIIQRTRTVADSLGLSPDFAEQLMTVIMGHSVREQKKLHHSQRMKASSSLHKVLVIGGLGRMGRWFSQYFQSIGFQVSIFDTKSHAAPEGWSRHVDVSQGLDQYEIILLTTPIAATQSILKALAKQRPKGLVIETSSLKSPIRSGLQELIESGVKVASIHPMFGPDTDLLIDRNILICRGTGLVSEDAARLYFHSTSAHLVPIDIDQHDPHMVSVLGLTHFINILFGICLSEQDLPMSSARLRGGSTFLSQLETSLALFAENHELYFDIQAQNPYSSKLYAKLREVSARIEHLVEARDRDGFLMQLARATSALQKTL
jgi:chorismate mutase/prephenate dehydrogenase